VLFQFLFTAALSDQICLRLLSLLTLLMAEWFIVFRSMKKKEGKKSAD